MAADEDKEPAQTSLGHRDRYRLQKKPLGVGGFATVFEAYDKLQGRSVAFKKLRVQDREAKHRFQREITVQRTIPHRHVMPVLDADPLGGWYTMPLAVGSLESLAPDLSVEDVVQAIREAGAGLAEGHARQLTHRDVTPRNILALKEADGSLRWTIADWGLVRLPTGQSGSVKTQGPMGTPRFIAPELLRDPRAASVRSDLFSLGMVAEVLCETRGWGAEAGFERFVHACTAEKPGSRPADVVRALALIGKKGRASAPTFLLWESDGEATTTRLVRCDAGRPPEIVGTRPGLYLCDGDRLLTWCSSTHKIRIPDWESREGELRVPTKTIEVDIADVSLVDFDTGNSIRVTPVEPREKADDVYEIARTSTPLGVAGRFLYILEHLYEFGGGAHGFTYATFKVVDGRTGLAVEALSPMEFEAFFAKERAEAIEAHRSSEHFQEGFISEEELNAAALTAYWPTIGRKGATGIEVQVTFSCAYASTDGSWSSYTLSRRVRTDRIPEPLLEVGSLPGPMATLLQAQDPRPKAVGWSRVPDVPRAEGWLAHFAAK